MEPRPKCRPWSCSVTGWPAVHPVN